MGKRTKAFERMMKMYEQRLAAAEQPNQWETMMGDEVRRRQSRTSSDIMTENLGALADWNRRYQVGVTPESSVRSKAYKLSLGQTRDLGARELARDYGRLGEQSVTNYRNQTYNMMGGAQQTAAQRMWNAVNGTGQGAQMWSSFRPGGGWFEGLQKAVGLAGQVLPMLFGGGG